MHWRILFLLGSIMWVTPVVPASIEVLQGCLADVVLREQVDCLKGQLTTPLVQSDLQLLRQLLPEAALPISTLLEEISAEQESAVLADPALAAGFFDLQGQALLAQQRYSAAATAFNRAIDLDDGTTRLTWVASTGGEERILRLDPGIGLLERAARSALASDQRDSLRPMIAELLDLGVRGWVEEAWSDLGGEAIDPSLMLTAPPWHEPLPHLEIGLMDGSSYSLSEAQGRVLVLAFWATWCKPCAEELPYLQELYLAERENGLDVMTVNVWESIELAQPYARDMQLELPLGMIDQDLENALDISVLPTLILADRSGAIRGRWSGADARILDQFEAAARLLLASDKEEPVEIANVLEGGELIEAAWSRPMLRLIQAIEVLPQETGGAQIVAAMRNNLLFFASNGTISREVRRPSSVSMLRVGDLNGDGTPDLFGARPGSRTISFFDLTEEEVASWEAPSPVFDIQLIQSGADDTGGGLELLLGTLDGLYRTGPLGDDPRKVGVFTEVSSLEIAGPSDHSGYIVLEAGKQVSWLDSKDEVQTRQSVPENSWSLVAGAAVVDQAGVVPAGVPSSVVGRFLEGEALQVALALKSGQLILQDLASGETRFRANWEGITNLAAGDLDGDGLDELVVALERSLTVLSARKNED